MPSAVPTAAVSPPADAVPTTGYGQLALTLQEVLTAVVRLRAGRQPVTDPAVFRAQMTQLLARADHEARAAGYRMEDVQLAVFAVVALLDESALNAPQRFAEWARRPLQDELFGGHMAGEWFFQHIEQLLARLDSPALADVLEVYELVLLLGFRGRYGAGDPAALHAIGARVGERIARIRGGAGPAGVAAGDLVAGWRPPDDVVAGGDPWVRRLSIGLAASVAVLVLLWVGGYASLGGSVDELRSIVPAAAR